jgi:hypothetical protein
VEVTDQATTGGIGTLPPGSRQVQKLGDIRYSQLRRWVPQGFRPAEQVVTWLNLPSGGTRSLTLQQKADSDGKVYFNIDVTGLPNGFYSIVAHGNDTKTEIVGEFRVIESPIVSNNQVNTARVLIPVANNAATSIDDSLADQFLVAELSQATGTTTLNGVVAAAGSSGATRLEGVHVTVIDGSQDVVGSATTDLYGGYVINGLAEGTYTVAFDPHFAFDAGVRRYQPAAQTAVEIPASGSLQVDAELALGSSISGLVTGTGAGGLEGVTVVLLFAGNVVEATTTDGDGRYTLEGVPSGAYTIEFDPNTSANSSVLAFDPPANPLNVTVAAPTPLSGQNVNLERGTDTVEITGQVVAGDNGAPLNDIFVVFERSDGQSGYEYAGLALTDATGAYSAVLPPGTYRVAFRPSYSTDPDSSPYLPEYFNDIANGPTGATEFDLSGGEIGRADAVLARGGTIAGTVTGNDGPLADVGVLSYNADDVLVDIALTGEDGTYRTGGLPAGDYRVEFVTYLTDNADTVLYAGTTREGAVTVGAQASVTGIDATLTQGGAISGTVSGTGGVPLADVFVIIEDTRGTSDTSDDLLAGFAFTAEDGTYTTSGLASGEYLLLFVAELAGDAQTREYFDEFYDDATTVGDADAVTVTVGATTTGIDATLRQGGQIRGQVTDGAVGGGFGIAGVLVEVYREDDTGNPRTLVGFAITDESGNYATTALETGVSYILRFDPLFGGGAGQYQAEYYDDAETEGEADAVEVPSTTPVNDINAELNPPI